MLGNEGKRFVGIDSFGFRDASAREGRARTSRGSGSRRPEILVGDAFELVPGGALDDIPVGVWYYDAAHSYEAQVEGLRIAEPLLAPGALVIVDDTDWDDVARAMDDYLAEQPRARRILTIDGKSPGSSPVVGGDAGPRLGRLSYDAGAQA